MDNTPTTIELIADNECDWENDNFDPEHEDLIRGTWTIEGARTLGEAVALLREEATRLENLERDGWRLMERVDRDYWYIERD